MIMQCNVYPEIYVVASMNNC